MDLIDRKQLIEKCAWTLFDCSEVVDVDDILKFPTIEAEPVKHGHWIWTGSCQVCSICDEEQYGVDTGRYYCPNCGAKMDEV